MTKTWYPVIDREKCIECGACVNHCPHDVYDKEKDPTPVVGLPENCVQGCHGCGNICPVGAITYKGEDTDWVPPKGKEEESKSDSNCGCGGSCGGDCG